MKLTIPTLQAEILRKMRQHRQNREMWKGQNTAIGDWNAAASLCAFDALDNLSKWILEHKEQE